MSAIPLKQTPALAKSVRLRTDQITSEPVLLYPEGLMELNETAHAIVSRCDGIRTVDEIVAEISAEYETETAELKEDVLLCLESLRAKGLIDCPPLPGGSGEA